VCCAQVQRLFLCRRERQSLVFLGEPPSFRSCSCCPLPCDVCECVPPCFLFWQVSSIIRALKLGVSVLMLDMDTQPSKRALFPADTLPDADLVYVPCVRRHTTVSWVFSWLLWCCLYAGEGYAWHGWVRVCAFA
jgi:hypothetical protein